MACGPLAARFHEAVTPPATASEVDAYARLVGADVLRLDVLCGTGRLLVPWLLRGGSIHGVDPSASMLERCEAGVAAAGLATTLFRQDIGELNLPFRYGAAVVAAGALQAITDPAAVTSALERLRAHLVAPGVLVLDLRIPPLAQQNLAAPLVEVRTARLADGTQMTLRSETVWTPEARLARADNRYSQRRGAQRMGEEHAVVRRTWYEQDEAIAIVRAAGFEDVVAAPAVHAGEAAAFTIVARSP